jgi:hypothetical protein
MIHVGGSRDAEVETSDAALSDGDLWSFKLQTCIELMQLDCHSQNYAYTSGISQGAVEQHPIDKPRCSDSMRALNLLVREDLNPEERGEHFKASSMIMV